MYKYAFKLTKLSKHAEKSFKYATKSKIKVLLLKYLFHEQIMYLHFEL